MLTDHWDISHICVAVPDLDAAKRMYEGAFGVTGWGPLIDFVDDMEMDVASPLLGAGVSMKGLREIWALDGAEAVTGGPPFAPLELACAERFSPAHAIWGCPDGRQYVHHICYWVDDLEAESAHLIEHGFALELTTGSGERARGFAYHRSPSGMRVEIMRRADKEPHARWLETGVIDLEWT